MSVHESQNKKSVLFVCLGNIIRSPTCEGLFRKLTNNQYVVDSAAVTEDDLNQHPSQHAITVSKEHGFYISNHISRLITKEDFERFNIIVSLEYSVQRELERLKSRINPSSNALIVPFADRDIPNPWFCGYKDFVRMYAIIEEKMNVFIKKYFPEVKIEN